MDKIKTLMPQWFCGFLKKYSQNLKKVVDKAASLCYTTLASV
jgi:hypothetical protein